jgi:fused signal recognition particle receptor
MFGFLRRKKPAEPDAAPDTAPAAELAVAPAEASSPAEAVAPAGATEAEPPPPAGQESSPRRSFWSRFIPGGRTQDADGASSREADELAAPPQHAEPATEAAEAGDAAPHEVPMPRSPGASEAPAAAAAPEPAAATPVAPPRVAPPPAAPVPAAQAELIPAPMPDRKPWLARLKQGLARTSGNLAGLFVGVKVDEALFEELETALLTSDAGVETTQWLLDRLRERVKKERLTESQQVKAALRALLLELLLPLEQPVDIDRATPLVVMIAGVNGAGKTTSIGKLARHLRREGKSVLLAAGDTFRAAAREQLAQWGSRNEVDVIAQEGGDPAAVAFDAVSAGRARATGVVMIDTAGRLPTQTHLMDELKKVRRVIGKAMDGAPHEVLLVLDGNTGQNMLAQVKAFDEAVQLTGLVVTKLDGTAKGGALAALAYTRRAKPVPVYFIGVGEGIDDLQAFSAEEFAAALLD